MALMAALAGLTHSGDLLTLGVAAVAILAWAILSDRSMRTGLPRAPLAALGAGTAALLALAGIPSTAGGPLERWQQWADLPSVAAVSTERLLRLAGVFVVQLSTANIVVQQRDSSGGRSCRHARASPER
jgi:hypothetical protein